MQKTETVEITRDEYERYRYLFLCAKHLVEHEKNTLHRYYDDIQLTPIQLELAQAVAEVEEIS